MREAMDDDSNTLQLSELLPERTFDSHSSLSLVEHDGIVLDDRPLVDDMCVGSNRRRAATRFNPGGPQMARGIKAHHVGRC